MKDLKIKFKGFSFFRGLTVCAGCKPKVGKEGPMNDEQLNKLLNNWEIDPVVPATFHRDVWHRIERQRSGRIPGAWWNAMQVFLESLHRPVFAVSLYLVLALGGLGGGILLGNIQESNQREELKMYYQASINPLSPQRMKDLR